MDKERDRGLIIARLELGERIQRENDIMGTSDGVLSDAESQALLLAILHGASATDERNAVPETTIVAIFKRFEEAKKQWLTLRHAITVGSDVELVNGRLYFRLYDGVKEIINDEPRFRWLRPPTN